MDADPVPDSAELEAARVLFDSFLPPEPFRCIDRSLYDLEPCAGLAEALLVWDVAGGWAPLDAGAADAAHWAEVHARRLAGDTMVGVDQLAAERPVTGPQPVLARFAEALGHQRDELWERASALALGSPAAGDGVAPDAGAELAAAVARRARHSGTPALECEPDMDPVGNGTLPAALAPRFESAATAADHVVDVAGFVTAKQLGADIADLRPLERAELAVALARRHDELDRWANRLVVQEWLAATGVHLDGPAEVAPIADGEPRVPAAPAAVEIAALALEPGVDVHTLADRLGEEPAWVVGVLDGSVDSLGLDQARRLCQALDRSPVEVFGAAGAELWAGAGWAVVPYDPFDHEPHLEPFGPDPELPAIGLDVGFDLGPF